MLINSQNTKHQSGFTLIELLTVVAVIAVMLTLAVVSFTSAIEKSAAETFREKFRHDLSFARSEAISTGKTIKMMSLSPVLGNPQWELGWKLDNNGTQIKVHKGDDGAKTTITSSNGIKEFAFSPSGSITLKDTSDATTATSTTITFGTGTDHQMTISTSGLIE